MPRTVSFTDPYAQDYAELARNQKMAELLRQQANEPIGDTQMVSGWAIPQSKLSGLNKVAQSALAAYAQYNAGERERMLAEKVREGGKKDATDFITALQGTPAKPSTYEADTFDEADKAQLAMDMGTPAVAGDKNKALAIALGSGNPMVQGAGSALMADLLKGKKPIVLGKTLVDPDTYQPVAVDQTWQADQQAAREARNAEQQATREQRMQELNMRLEDQRLSRQEQAALRRELAHMQDATRRDLATAIGAGAGKPPAGYRWKQDGTLEYVPGGPADPKNKTGADGMPKLTESQGRANLFQSRATEADKIMSGLEGKYSPMAINAKQGAGKVWGIGGALETVGNAMLPENAQKVEQAQRDFVNAVLRQESGAVINPSEFENAQKQYFPQPGDSQAVINQKRKNRNTAIEGLRVMSGPAATQAREQPQAPSGGATFLGFE